MLLYYSNLFALFVFPIRKDKKKSAQPLAIGFIFTIFATILTKKI